MKCPHCNKEVFGRSHNVADLYEEPKKLTKEEQLQADIERKNKALTYAVRFLNPKDCDREFVKEALKDKR